MSLRPESPIWALIYLMGRHLVFVKFRFIYLKLLNLYKSPHQAILFILFWLEHWKSIFKQIYLPNFLTKILLTVNVWTKLTPTKLVWTKLMQAKLIRIKVTWNKMILTRRLGHHTNQTDSDWTATDQNN